MASFRYPPRLALARLPTPFQPLDRLSDKLGGPRVWVKRDDLSECAISGNKIRKLEFTLARALEQGSDTLITCGGVQSNHCRATALLGARLGLKVHLILRREQTGDAPLNSIPDGNLFLDCLAGAKISLYDKNEYQKNLPDLFNHWSDYYRKQGARPYAIPTGASDGTGVWGYVACVAELREDFKRAGIAPVSIVHATGSGGTQAGLSAGVALHQLDARVIGLAVCDNERYFLNKVRDDIASWRARYDVSLDQAGVHIQVDDRFVGPGYGRAGDEVFATISEVAALEGLLLDPVYTGKAFYGMVEKIRAGEFAGESDLVFIHTGGIFGLMAQRDFVSIG